jgi:peptide-methionine (R)-S-oxide reductase
MEKVNKTNEEWRKELSPGAYRVLREKVTETPFSGKFYKNQEKGVYVCGACGNELFDSDVKFDSKTGWPSFFKPLNESAIELKPDTSHGIHRTEVLCVKCGSHLGHVFDDAPKTMPDGTETGGKRFCINSCALDLNKQ